MQCSMTSKYVEPMNRNDEGKTKGTQQMHNDSLAMGRGGVKLLKVGELKTTSGASKKNVLTPTLRLLAGEVILYNDQQLAMKLETPTVLDIVHRMFPRFCSFSLKSVVYQNQLLWERFAW